MLQNFFTKLISFVNVCWNACIILPIPKRISIRHLITAESRELFLWEINAMAKVNLTKFASANCTVMSLFQKQKEIHWSCRPVMKYFATRERMRPSLKHSTPILQTKAQCFYLGLVICCHGLTLCCITDLILWDLLIDVSWTVISLLPTHCSSKLFPIIVENTMSCGPTHMDLDTWHYDCEGVNFCLSLFFFFHSCMIKLKGNLCKFVEQVKN
jgi:hypothetical protein